MPIDASTGPALVAGTITGLQSITATPADFASIKQALEGNGSLQSIDFTADLSFGDAGVLLLVEALRANTRLKSLIVSLQTTNMTDIGANAIAGLIRDKPDLFSVLQLDQNALTDASGVNITNALSFSFGLQDITLSFCQLGNATASALARALTSPTCGLIVIDFTANKIGDKGAQDILAALPSNELCQQIALGRNVVSPSLLSSIATYTNRNIACAANAFTCPVIKTQTFSVSPVMNSYTQVPLNVFSMVDVATGLPFPISNLTVFNVQNVSGGYFCLNGSSVPLTNFTQAQINLRQIFFRYTDPTQNLPSFTLTGSYNRTYFTVALTAGAVNFTVTPITTTITTTTPLTTQPATNASTTSTTLQSTAAATNATTTSTVQQTTVTVTNATQAVTSTTTALTQATTNATATPTSTSITALINATTAVTQALTNATTALTQAMTNATTLTTQAATTTTATQTQSLTNATTALTQALTNATTALTQAATTLAATTTVQTSATTTTASATQNLTTASTALTQAMTNATIAVTSMQTTANATSATQALTTATTTAAQTLTTTTAAVTQVVTSATIATTAVPATNATVATTAAVNASATTASTTHTSTVSVSVARNTTLNNSAANVTSTTPEETPAASRSSSGITLAAIIGAGAGGGLLVLALLILAIVVYRARRKNKTHDGQPQSVTLLTLTEHLDASTEADHSDQLESQALQWANMTASTATIINGAGSPSKKTKKKPQSTDMDYEAAYGYGSVQADYAECNLGDDHYEVPVKKSSESGYDAALVPRPSQGLYDVGDEGDGTASPSQDALYDMAQGDETYTAVVKRTAPLKASPPQGLYDVGDDTTYAVATTKASQKVLPVAQGLYDVGDDGNPAPQEDTSQLYDNATEHETYAAVTTIKPPSKVLPVADELYDLADNAATTFPVTMNPVYDAGNEGSDEQEDSTLGAEQLPPGYFDVAPAPGSGTGSDKGKDSPKLEPSDPSNLYDNFEEHQIYGAAQRVQAESHVSKQNSGWPGKGIPVGRNSIFSASQHRRGGNVVDSTHHITKGKKPAETMTPSGLRRDTTLAPML